MHPREEFHDFDGLLRELRRAQRAREWSDRLATGLQDLCSKLTCDVNSLRDEVRFLRREHEQQRAFIEALSSDYALSQELLQEAMNCLDCERAWKVSTPLPVPHMSCLSSTVEPQYDPKVVFSKKPHSSSRRPCSSRLPSFVYSRLRRAAV
mmetsp:Transcript_72060/g.192195  ORF Transcript_72060/g.192195 Transcript_72060/m.192195 type:complete len:151 (-) Transcript_72060:42-494(-)